MRTLILPLLILLVVAHVAQAEDAGAGVLERGDIERWIDAPRQLFLWADPFEDSGLNYALNLFLGTAEALAGTILVSHGQRQVDFMNSGDEKGLRRVARRTAGEVVKTLLGHALRIAGVIRAAGGIYLGIAHLL
jgi:hypothetical protein